MRTAPGSLLALSLLTLGCSDADPTKTPAESSPDEDSGCDTPLS